MYGATCSIRLSGNCITSAVPRHLPKTRWNPIACLSCAEQARATSATYKVRGGGKLHGTLPVSGSKNSALAIIIASLLTSSETTIHNVPNLQDVHTTVCILQSLGVHVQHRTGPFEGTLIIDSSGLATAHPPDSLVQQIRSSFLLVGPLLGRLGSSSEVCITQPGGCRLGSRPVDLHLHVLQSMGVHVHQSGDRFRFTLPQALQGACVRLGYPSVGATCMFLLAAAAATGPSILENAACEPEVQDLAHMLTCMGAHIHGAGTGCIHVDPPAELCGCEYTVMPDRIEAGTFMAAAAMTASQLVVEPVVPAHMHAITEAMQAAGCHIEMFPIQNDTWCDILLVVCTTTWSCRSTRLVAGACCYEWTRDKRCGVCRKTTPWRLQHHSAVVEPRTWPLQAVDVCAEPFGGFPTDLQPQFAAMMAICGGSAVIRDTVFEERMGHVPMLRAMGAEIEHRSNQEVLVHGVARSHGGQLQRLIGVPGLHAADLRAGAALLLAALSAEGESCIENVEQISRGYAGIHTKLAGVGARIAVETEGKTIFTSPTY